MAGSPPPLNSGERTDDDVPHPTQSVQTGDFQEILAGIASVVAGGGRRQ